MIKIGMVLAERYEILEKIGTGGMSDVYRAKDHKLNRHVAVKVLKQEFAENTEFVRKFRTEAQAAAGLMHPNIVNVYDVGEENGSHFIVMELVEGVTLKKYIEKKARISVKEAVSIAIQVAQGIEAAHNNHIIHRDIKPQNIIISKEGKVKVTDFGIAKAATSNTITSNVMGSVHYTSPEQVRGGFSDEKSDIYSLGITLYEMLTGRVPYNGETTVAVAIKHIQEPMPSPRTYVPEIPISVEQIVLKCTQKSPDRRYQSAPELIEDLKRSLISPDEDFVRIDTNDAAGKTRDISKEEINQIKRETSRRDRYEEKIRTTAEQAAKQAEGQPAEAGYEGEGYEPGYEGDGYDPGYEGDGYGEEPYDDYPEDDYKNPALVAPELEPPRKKTSGTQQGAKRSGGTKSSAGGKKSGGSKTGAKSGASKGAAGKGGSSKGGAHRKSGRKGSSGRGGRYENDYDPRIEFLTTILIIVAAIVVGCIFLYLVGSAVGVFGENARSGFGSTQSGSDGRKAIPDVAGQPMADATALLEQQGFNVLTEYQTSAEIAEGRVISISPEAGAMLTEGGSVTIYVSSGITGASVPNVVGRSRAEAVAMLEGDGFTVEVLRENSTAVDKDTVISQDPKADSRIARGGTITIYVSIGTESSEVVVPDIKGKPEEEAIVLLEEAGLIPNAVGEEFSDTYTEGTVSYQSYPAGATVGVDTTVDYRISKGLDTVYYNVNYTVQAPADYAGGDFYVEIVGNDPAATQVYGPVRHSAFPVDINVTGLNNISSGHMVIHYNVNVEQQVEDANGNITVQNVITNKDSAPVTIQFTKAQ